MEGGVKRYKGETQDFDSSGTTPLAETLPILKEVVETKYPVKGSWIGGYVGFPLVSVNLVIMCWQLPAKVDGVVVLPMKRTSDYYVIPILISAVLGPRHLRPSRGHGDYGRGQWSLHTTVVSSGWSLFLTAGREGERGESKQAEERYWRLLQAGRDAERERERGGEQAGKGAVSTPPTGRERGGERHTHTHTHTEREREREREREQAKERYWRFLQAGEREDAREKERE
jgi:hypothetical protein